MNTLDNFKINDNFPPKFSVASDTVLFYDIGCLNEQILLIERMNDPFKFHYAIPGGFVELDEYIEDGATRELLEETGITIDKTDLHLVGVYSNPNRDPRGRVISIVYYAILNSLIMPVAGDDAKSAKWFRTSDLPPVAFDHDDIIQDAISMARGSKARLMN